MVASIRFALQWDGSDSLRAIIYSEMQMSIWTVECKGLWTV